MSESYDSSPFKALQELLIWCWQHESAIFTGLRGLMSPSEQKGWTFHATKVPSNTYQPVCPQKMPGKWGRTICPLAEVHNFCLKLNVYQKMHSHFHKNGFVGLQEDIRKLLCTFFQFLELKISSSASLNGSIVLLPATSFHVLWHLIPESNKKAAQ